MVNVVPQAKTLRPCGPAGFGLGTSLGTPFTMIPPRLFQIMSHYVIHNCLGKYQNCHLVLFGSFWFFLVLFLVLFSSVFGSLFFFSVFLLVLLVLSGLQRSENQSLVIPVNRETREGLEVFQEEQEEEEEEEIEGKMR